MRVETVCTGALMENCYVVFHNNAAIIIDPGADACKIKEIIGDSVAVRNIIFTHGHFDHIGAAKELAEFYRSEVLAYCSEIPLIEDINLNLSSQFGSGFYLNVDRAFSDGDIISFGNKDIKVIHTPGHTAGSCCFLIDDCLFTGDTVFYMSAGRTDFPTGSFDSLIFSLQKKLCRINDSCVIYPGHGKSSTMGFERLNNPYFNL